MAKLEIKKKKKKKEITAETKIKLCLQVKMVWNHIKQKWGSSSENKTKQLRALSCIVLTLCADICG